MNSRSRHLVAATLVSLVSLVSLCCAAPAWAQATTGGKTLTPQQKRMGECASANKGKTGADYKSSISSCLKEKPAEEKALTPQQQRMKDCNANASSQSLTGDKRKTFITTCLKGQG